MTLRDTITFEKDKTKNYLLVIEDLVLYRQAPSVASGTQTPGTPTQARIIEDLVLLYVDNSGRRLEKVQDTAESWILKVTEAPGDQTPKKPDFVFLIDDSFIQLSYSNLIIVGINAEDTGGDPQKGRWDFDLDEIDFLSIPQTNRPDGKTEFRIYLKD